MRFFQKHLVILCVLSAFGYGQATLSGAKQSGSTIKSFAVQQLVVTTVSLPSAVQGVVYSASLAASGGVAPYTWSITVGSLPSGLSLNASTGVISGTPSASGTTNFTVQVADSVSTTASAALSILVNPPPPPPLTITTLALPDGTVGTNYNQTLNATGGVTPYAWSISVGSLPSGMSLNSSTGVISGTPGSSATSSFTVTVTDAVLTTTSQNLSIKVDPAPPPPLTVNTTFLPNAQVASAYNQTLSASGGAPPYTWAITVGSLPAGLSLNASTGVISGTPSTQGTANFTVQVTDSAAATATQALSILVNPAPPPPLTITTTSLPSGQVGVSYGQNVTATGGVPPYAWSISAGSLPGGLSLNSSTGVISGTPSGQGTSSFTIKVTDSVLASATQNLSILVSPAALMISSAAPPGGTVGVVYGPFTLSGTGGVTPYSWSVALGSLPTGLSLNASTGVLTGTPSAAGTFNFTIQLQDSASTKVTAAYSVVILASNVALPALPQVWVNPLEWVGTYVNHYCVGTTVGPCDSGHTYAGSTTGLNQAVVDAEATRASGGGSTHIAVQHGLLLTSNGATGIGILQLKQIAGDTRTDFIVIQSDTPLTSGHVACLDATWAIGAASNYNCTPDVSSMFTIQVTGNNNPAIDADGGAHNYVVADAEIRNNIPIVPTSGQSGIGTQGALVYLGLPSATTANTGSNLSTDSALHIGLTRVWVHGYDTVPGSNPAAESDIQHAVLLTCGYCWVVDSQINQIHMIGTESQGLDTVNAPGPVLYANNHVEAASENIFFGGAVPSIANNVTSDVEIRLNYVTKPYSLWYNIPVNGQVRTPCSTGKCPDGAGSWVVKNAIEFKEGQRVLEDGNVFEYSWQDGQSGALGLHQVRACSSGSACNNPNIITADITSTNNIWRHSLETFQNDARSGGASAGVSTALGERRELFQNSLFYDEGNETSFCNSGGTNCTTQVAAVNSSGDTFSCSPSRDALGQTTTLTCTSGGTGKSQVNMSVGDPVQVTNCSPDASFNVGVSAIGPPALAGTTPTGLVVVYTNPGTANAGGGTTCTLGNRQGYPFYFTFDHNTVVTGATNTFWISENGGLTVFPVGSTYTNSIFASLNGTQGLICASPTQGEGTKSEACWNQTSAYPALVINHIGLQGRTVSKYTEFPSGIIGGQTGSTLWGPTNPGCSGAVADSTCVGFSGFMSGVAFSSNASDYHAYALDPSSLFNSTWQAADGTPNGANITKIDSAQQLNKYVCQTSCGTGPFNIH